MPDSSGDTHAEAEPAAADTNQMLQQLVAARRKPSPLKRPGRGFAQRWG